MRTDYKTWITMSYETGHPLRSRQAGGLDQETVFRERIQTCQELDQGLLAP